MNDFLNKISLYDQLGYIAVGGVFYGCIWFDFWYLKQDIEPFTSNTLMVSLAIYFLGHIIQAFSNFIKKEKPVYNDNQKKILIEVKKFFNLDESTDDNMAWGLCYMWALGVDKTSHISIMNANYGLYRGWAIVLFIQAGMFLSFISLDAYNCLFYISNLIGLILSFLCGLLLIRRSQRFYSYLGNKVIQAFMIRDKNL